MVHSRCSLERIDSSMRNFFILLEQYTPKAIVNMVEEVIQQTIFFRTVGIIGTLAVHSVEM